MKKEERKVLRRKLFIAVKKVLKENQDALQDKTIIAINKSLKYIAKKTDKKNSVPSKKIKSSKSKSL